MIIKENVTIYKCQHCKKKMFVKRAMEHHEKYCSANPENFKACEGCIHLEEIGIGYSPRDNYDNERIERIAKGFKCKKTGNIMYPTKAERKGLIKKYPLTFEGQIPMPKECELKQLFYGDDGNYDF